MELNILNVIQNELRNEWQLPKMIQLIKEGGRFDTESLIEYHRSQPYANLPHDKAVGGLIEISAFPDGAFYLHNGHHRAVAIHLAGREFLYDDEFYVKQWEYRDYDSIVFHNPDGSWRGYVTPLDIRVEARKKDIGHFKDKVRKIYCKLGEQFAIRHIQNSKGLYTTAKRYYTVPQFSDATIKNFASKCRLHYCPDQHYLRA